LNAAAPAPMGDNMDADIAPVVSTATSAVAWASNAAPIVVK